MISGGSRPAAGRTSVVLVNYNGAADTDRCLASLGQLATPPPVIVVDNGSRGNDIVNVVNKHSHAKLIRSAENLGFGRANNLALREALRSGHSEFLFILNNDTTVEPQALEALESELDQHPEAAIATPRIVLAAEPSILWYGGGEIDWRKGSARVPGFLSSAFAESARVSREVTFATGCASLVRRSVLETLGGFDPRFFMYEEDVEFSLRVLAAGFTIRYVPAAIVHHTVQGSTRASGLPVMDGLSPAHPRLPFFAYHRTRNTLLTMALHARGRRLALFLSFFPLVQGRRLLRFLAYGRFDGISATIRGAYDFAKLMASHDAFVDEVNAP